MSRRYLASCYGKNMPTAIKCVKFYIQYEEPFHAHDIGVSGQTIKNMANKGIIIALPRESGPRRYTISPSMVSYIMARNPDEFDQ